MNHETLKSAPPRDGSCIEHFPESPEPIRMQRILIADDDELIRHLMSITLSDAGFDANAAADGEQAWEALQRDHYDLLVTDNEMPRLAGIKLIERIRKEGMNLPIIVVSGSASAETAHDNPQLQIAAVLPKPFDIQELLPIVKTALRASGEDATPRPQVLPPVPTKLAADPLMEATTSRTMRPRTLREAPSHTASSSHTAPQPKTSAAVHNRILIADDDSLVRGSLAAVLESEGYVVDEARNGIDAVRRAVERLPDLVLLDLNMPHRDGWTAFRQLDRVRPLLPVIVITARPNQYEEAVRLGVDAFMEKPLNLPMLLQAIKRLVTETPQRHVSRVTSRGFVTRLLSSACP
jgi:DNA-binding response OmpR family regulator